MTTTVFHTPSETEHVYTLPPREAVLAAFALSMGDANSWNWEKRWNHYVKRTPHGWAAGDWWAYDTGGKKSLAYALLNREPAQ